MRKYSKFLCIAVVLVMVLALAACGGGSSSSGSSGGGGAAAVSSDDWEGLHLTLVTNYPRDSYNTYIYDYWLDRVGEASDGKITGEIFGGETLMKNTDQLPGVLEGTADVVLTDPAYNPEYFPLLGAFFLPGFILNNSSVSTYVAGDLIRETNYAETQQLKMLWANGLTPPGLYGNKKFSKLEDFPGAQIRANGFAVDTVNNVGATAVALTSAEVYEALLKGTVDATLMGLDALMTFNLAEVTTYVSKSPGLTNIFHYAGMNLDTWNKIPADIQAKIDEINRECTEVQAPRWDSAANQGIDLAIEHGAEIDEISPAEMQRIFEHLSGMRADWIAKMEAQGLDGQATLDYLDSLAEKYNKQFPN